MGKNQTLEFNSPLSLYIYKFIHIDATAEAIMSKMKHLLRKLHIGNDQQSHHRRTSPAAPPSTTLSPSSSSPSPPSVSVTVDSGDRTVPAENVEVNGSVRNPNRDFNFMEEEFQVQLAMALSASDPETRNDEESHQIKAAKQLSLACSPSVPDNERLSEFISLKYWVSLFSSPPPNYFAQFDDLGVFEYEMGWFWCSLYTWYLLCY